MGLFRKATRTAGRVAKNVAKEAVFGDLENEGGSKKGHRKGGVAKPVNVGSMRNTNA